MGWYVAYCKANCDHIAEFNLEKQNLTVFRPVFKRAQENGRNSPHMPSLFPRYLFIKDRHEIPINFSAVNSTKGIVRIITFGNHVPKIEDELIESLKMGGAARIQDMNFWKNLKPGDFVKVQIGQESTVEGFFQSIDGHDRINILLSILGQRRLITAHSSQVAVKEA